MPATLLQPLLTLDTLDSAMVTIQGGTFRMGSNNNSDEKPIHKVLLSDFMLCRYPVTQSLWMEVIGADPDELYFTGSDRPVESVSWDYSQIFLEKLNRRPGFKGYRLPTEAEWEFASRGGERYNQGFEYAGGADLDEVGWYDENSFGETHAQGLKLPNALGLYDLSGNVWEWCQDRYNEKYYASSPDVNPQGPDHGERRVIRGGSWGYFAALARVSRRGYWYPDRRFNSLGFRLARSL